MNTYIVTIDLHAGTINEKVVADEYRIGQSGCVTFYTEDGLRAVISYAHGRWMEVKQES